MKAKKIMALAIAGCLMTSVMANAEIKTKNMSIGEYKGTAQAIANSGSGSASTVFTSGGITCKVSATFYYKDANGTTHSTTKNKTATTVATVEYSHTGMQKVASTHNATAPNGAKASQVTLTAVKWVIKEIFKEFT